MAESAWVVAHAELTDAGWRYIVCLGDDIEWIVLHSASGWQAWNGHARCEMRAGVRSAVLDYERVSGI